MNQLEYITRQLSRAERKRFEHYVVTRIWHQLDDLALKFVTQQYVKRPQGIALTDMYFPQLKLHIEVDEGQHFDRNGNRIQQDNMREMDIINATGHRVERVITADKSLKDVNSRIKEVVGIIKGTKAHTDDFRPWDYAAEYNPETYLNRGYIDLKEDVAFRIKADAANCFGNNYHPNALQAGVAKHPFETNKILWFPKLYRNDRWNNSISDDGTVITEMCEDEARNVPHIEATLQKPNLTRIVFARVKSSLGDIMYRFVGEFAVDTEQTNNNHGVVYRRISERVNTYRHDSN